MFQKANLVMVFRQVGHLDETADFLVHDMGIPIIGRDGYTVMLDAGSYILAVWSKEDLLNQINPATGLPLRASSLSIQVSLTCLGFSMDESAAFANSALQLTFAAPMYSDTVTNICARTGSVARTFDSPLGHEMPFLDPSGNAYSLVDASASTTTRHLTNRTARKPDGKAASGVGIALTVSDLDRSSAFYTEILGLRELLSSSEVRSYDAGSTSILLRQQRTAGELDVLRRLGALDSDLLLFHSGNVERDVEELKSRGARFPNGIEKFVGGDWAKLLDPDGHNIGVWQPADAKVEQSIPYRPILSRMLSGTYA